MNKDKAHAGNVGGMLLYARTTADIQPETDCRSNDGNIIMVKTLDMVQNFEYIKNDLDNLAIYLTMQRQGNAIKSPIFAISKLRMGTDGEEITTLVAFMGCPLNCKYCLNPQCHEPVYEADGTTPRKGIMLLTPQELYDMVKIDNLYFQATGGDICFGGGEPTMYADFIEEFRWICDQSWKITLETCLCCSYNIIKQLSKVVNRLIVDIKTMDLHVYEQYTGEKSGVIQHLKFLQMNVPPKEVTIKVSLIPRFTDERNIDRDITEIGQNFNFTDIVKTRYRTDNP